MGMNSEDGKSAKKENHTMTAEELKRAMAVAETLEKDERGVIVPPAALRKVLRKSTPPPGGVRPRAPLDDDAVAKVIALKRKGIPLMRIAKAMGTTYHMVQRIHCPAKTATGRSV